MVPSLSSWQCLLLLLLLHHRDGVVVVVVSVQRDDSHTAQRVTDRRGDRSEIVACAHEEHRLADVQLRCRRCVEYNAFVPIVLMMLMLLVCAVVKIVVSVQSKGEKGPEQELMMVSTSLSS